MTDNAPTQREIEWLRRLLRWCRPRLTRLRTGRSYQEMLDKYLAAGPTDLPVDEPAIVQSDPPKPPVTP